MKKLLIAILVLAIFPLFSWADEKNQSADDHAHENCINIHNPLHIFIHICTINHWKDVLERQLTLVKSSGLLDQCQSISLGILGEGDILPFIEKYPKLRILFQLPDISLYERPTLFALHEFCVSNTNALVLYLHTKGVSRPNMESVTDWARYMEYYTIELWKDCVEALREKDACGVNWRDKPALHFSGNFWWATAKYISSLPDQIGPNYTDPEFWIGLNQPNVKNFYESYPILHYKQRFPEYEYKYRDKRYILVATSGGPFGTHIKDYLNKAKSLKLQNKLYMHPSFCQLSSIFTSDLTPEGFTAVLQDLLQEMNDQHIPKNTQIKRLCQGGPRNDTGHMDYIEINAPFFLDFAKEFVKKQNLPEYTLDDKNLPLRLVLRNSKFNDLDKLAKLQKLQKNINLNAYANWSICIYKVNDDKLEFVTDCLVK